MSKHTPKPWIAENCTITCENGTVTIAEVVDQSAGDDPHANARLIAAAPELLDACSEAAQLIEAFCEGYPDIACDTRVSRVQRQLTSVRARALGEE